ncbi:RNA recognition motif domain-containing protein [Pedobacter sp. MW01-1-1]|uniref:RNA recognition motif domain-containing protein n=1 Tax=Pedobacter sp. MW01-1-1 TaxID=3383027 RepID=UPI003FEEB746
MPKLFIGGLAANIQEMDLAILISLHGRLDTIKVVRDRNTGKCKGYAFFEVVDMNDANNIIRNLNGESFKGNTITIKISEDMPPKKPFRKPFNPSFKKRPTA